MVRARAKASTSAKERAGSPCPRKPNARRTAARRSPDVRPTSTGERGGNIMSAHGIGLRAKHYSDILAHGVDVPIVEAITENFVGRGGRPRAVLERVRRD